MTAASRSAPRARPAGAASSSTTRAGPRREHGDPVAEVERLLDVVGDEDDRPRLRRQRRHQPFLHLGPGDRVEGGERLVEGEHRLLGEQRAQEGDALPHPARELGGPRPLEAAEPEAGEALAPPARGPAPRRRPRLRSASAALSSAESQGKRRSRCGMKAQRASRPSPAARRRPRSSPPSGSRSPQISSSRVDLPHPEGPTSPSTSCARASRSMPVDRLAARRRSGGRRPDGRTAAAEAGDSLPAAISPVSAAILVSWRTPRS